LQRKNLTSMHIDITELIKKVINLENWSSGNSIMLVLKNDDPLFLKFFDFSENADKVAMISKTDVTTTTPTGGENEWIVWDYNPSDPLTTDYITTQLFR
jgi:hypothetical protein